MYKLLFTDLDDTLFQSYRKSAPEFNSRILAVATNQEPVSYAHNYQWEFLQLLLSAMTVIPVTARNSEMFSRVSIKFPAEVILDYGGIILNSSGEVDQVWLEKSQINCKKSSPQLILWQEWVNSQAFKQYLKNDIAIKSNDIYFQLITDFDLIFYAAIKSNSRNFQLINEVYQTCCQARDEKILPDMIIHQHGSVIAILPRWLDKSNAVQYLINQYLNLTNNNQTTDNSSKNNLLTIGMGDSILDLNFIKACQYHIIPQNSQLSALLNK